MANEISVQYGKALELDRKIKVSAQMAQASLWDMCSGLKEMRDGKLYKELGYQNFEEYCETEHGFSRRNAYRYVSIAENVNTENVTSMSHFGSTKLYLLSTLSEADQEKITAENDVEDMTVKELEAEIRELKEKNSELENSNDELCAEARSHRKSMANLKDQLSWAKHEKSDLEKEITELRLRPIEATVTEPTDDVRQLKETIKNLERVSEEQVDQLQEEHLRDIRKLHEQNRAETEKQLADQKAEYEKKLAEAQAKNQTAGADDKQVFKAYYTAAYDSFSRMVEFAEKSDDTEFFHAKIASLISAFTNMNRR